MADPIRPRDLPPVTDGIVNPGAATIVDGGGQVQRATPLQVLDAAAPLSSQADAEAGSDNVKRMTPLRVKQAIATIPDTLPVNAPTAAALALKAGSAYSRAGEVGNVTTGTLDRLRALPRIPLEFGAASDAFTNDAVALGNLFAAASAAGGGPTPLSGRYYINSLVQVPPDVQIDGMGQGGIYADRTGSNYGQRRGLIIFGPNGGLNMGERSAIRRTALVRDICTVNPTSEAECLGAINAFSGDAITVNGAQDVTIEDNIIVGFNRACIAASGHRLRFEGNKVDCNSGVEMQTCYDTPHIHRNHIWPFWSANREGYSNAVLVRKGAGINLHDTVDGPLVSFNLVYGYKVGIDIKDSYAGKYVGNWIDNAISEQATQLAIGIRTRGIGRLNSFLANHVDSHDVNYDFAHDGNMAGIVATGNTSGSARSIQVRCGAGNGSFTGARLAGSAANGSIVFSAGNGSWEMDDIALEQSTAPALASALGTQADRAKINFGRVRLNSTSASFDPRAWTTYIDSQSNADQALSNAPVRVLFNNKPIDALGELVGNTQFMPKVSAEYQFDVSVTVTPTVATAGTCIVSLYRNGTESIRLFQDTISGTNIRVMRFSASATLVVGEGVEVYVRLDQGGVLSASPYTSLHVTRKL